uniref:Uncharacterized protein n=1 Tax=Cucumis melo TaxID=3656 RepID=A0A9I9EJH1_CUCME
MFWNDSRNNYCVEWHLLHCTIYNSPVSCTTNHMHNFASIPVNLNEENYLWIFAASDLKLPTIINGFEVFYFANLCYSPTFS